MSRRRSLTAFGNFNDDFSDWSLPIEHPPDSEDRARRPEVFGRRRSSASAPTPSSAPSSASVTPVGSPGHDGEAAIRRMHEAAANPTAAMKTGMEQLRHEANQKLRNVSEKESEQWAHMDPLLGQILIDAKRLSGREKQPAAKQETPPRT